MARRRASTSTPRTAASSISTIRSATSTPPRASPNCWRKAGWSAAR
jgi:hypothetical protein